MNPREFYQVAQKIVLASPPPGPAWCRTAIGRAYFASLNVAVSRLDDLGADCGKGAAKHGHAVAFLYASGDADLKTASVTLDYLKAARNNADYEMQRTDVEKVPAARLAVERAKDVLDFCDAFESDPARKTEAASNIKAYILKTRRMP
jgi:hypothetical protein